MRAFPNKIWDEHQENECIYFPNKVDMSNSRKNCDCLEAFYAVHKGFIEKELGSKYI